MSRPAAGGPAGAGSCGGGGARAFRGEAEHPADGLTALVDRLEAKRRLSEEEWIRLLKGQSRPLREYAAEKARAACDRVYGRKIFVRGLIEITSYCKNDCYYCGIRRGNRRAQRYRLSREEILTCCREGYRIGFRTFVLQGGEDPALTDGWVKETVAAIRREFPDCAITLSLGEKEYESYRLFFEAGADRYLLRHETADAAHYGALHPPQLSLAHRLQCLRDLKAIGYQTGCGFMVGSPGQTARCLAEDMAWIGELDPEMVGIGPFIPQRDTPFGGQPAGTLEQTLFLLSLLRLLKPSLLLPATTALGTIHPRGRELGILAGANVIMPNLSPPAAREKYLLYDNKLCTGDEAAEHLDDLKRRMAAIGCEVAVDRGDWKSDTDGEGRRRPASDPQEKERNV